MFLELEAIVWQKSPSSAESKMHLFDGLGEITLCGKQIPFGKRYLFQLWNQDYANCKSCMAKRMKVGRKVWRDSWP